MPASAAQSPFDESFSRKEEGELLATFQINEQGELTIQPRNVDLAPMSQTTNLSKFHVGKGTNIKIHLYISAASTNIYVHFREGGGYANADSTVKAIWKGTGHKYADLKLNAPANDYSVYLRGAFVGSGAVYSEP